MSVEVIFLMMKQKELEKKLRRIEAVYNVLKEKEQKRYFNSPEWIKNKGVTINPKNTKDNNCFQYATIAALNYQNINHHPERIYTLEPFIDNYNLKGIEFPSHSKDWRKFECNNKAIVLNILYVSYNSKRIKQACISKYNNERDNHVHLLMITDGDCKWHYLAVKNIS